jgi:drug/metabolite transporter (DMT)-like permease
MEESTRKDRSILHLIRVILWSQVIGYLWQSSAVALADAPDYFARMSFGSFIIPILVIIAIHVFKLDCKFAQSDPGWVFIALGFLISLSAAVITFSTVRFYFNLPQDQVTDSWRSSQVTSLVSLIIYSLGFILTSVFSYQVLRNTSIGKKFF